MQERNGYEEPHSNSMGGSFSTSTVLVKYKVLKFLKIVDFSLHSNKICLIERYEHVPHNDSIMYLWRKRQGSIE